VNATDNQSHETINQLCAQFSRLISGTETPVSEEFCEPVGCVGFCRFEADQNI
jgi:hypothetical protein